MLCQFAHQFPEFVAGFFERGRVLQRRFREETVTDLIMGQLLAIGRPDVIVEFPDETKTGADMEWNFVNRDKGTFFRLLVQAKQLYGDGNIWRRLNYRELFHHTGRGGPLQVSVLCNAARSATHATVPIYFFYNPQSARKLADSKGYPNLRGINWADGYLVERLVTSAATRAQRTSHKSLGKIYPLLHEMPDLLCTGIFRRVGPLALFPGAGFAVSGRPILIGPRGIAVALPPRPEDIRERLLTTRSLAAPVAPLGRRPVAQGQVRDDIDASPIPEVSANIPPEITRVIEARGERADSRTVPLLNWRVTFLSSEPARDEG